MSQTPPSATDELDERESEAVFVVARILIILADNGNRRMLQTLLKSAGYVIEAVSEPGAAEESLKQGEFELAILDLEYPRARSGFVVLRELRSAALQQPVLFVAPGAGAEDILALMRLGADDVLRKNLRPEELLATVRRLLHRYRELCR